MENAAHTLCGLVLARAGGERLSPLATPTIVLAANLPDLDVLGVPFGGDAYYLCHHRGLTHALLGLAVESVLLAALMFFVASRLRAGLEPARFRGLWAAAGIGLLSHLALDSLNTYGVRPFLPFDSTWFYGDAAFIVDPWLWLILGCGALVGAPRVLPPALGRPSTLDADLEQAQAQAAAGDPYGAAAAAEAALIQAVSKDSAAHEGASSRAKLTRWAIAADVFWGVLTFGALTLLFRTDRAPLGVALLWTAGWSVVWLLRIGRPLQARRRQVAWLTLGVAVIYLLGLASLQRRADGAAREAAREAGLQVTLSTTHPAPAIPWRFNAVVASDQVVRFVSVDLVDGARLDARVLPRRLDHPGLVALEGTRELESWRCFARIPFVAESPAGGGALILGDARYLPWPSAGWCNLEARPPARENR